MRMGFSTWWRFNMFSDALDLKVSMKNLYVLAKCGLDINYDFWKIKRIVAEVTIDQTHHSLSFNEYLTLISNNRRAQPSEANLIDAFGYLENSETCLC